MRRWLIAHEDFSPPPGLRVRADFGRRSAQTFGVTFTVYGQIHVLDWHDADVAGRYDELWRHGCFEAFLSPVGQPDYVEFNFAPVHRWAAYAFDDQRQKMRNADVILHRQDWFVRELSVPRVEMHALLEVPGALSASDWALNIATILEAKDGTKSYWALAHAPGPPDFHNRDCFIAQLPAPEA